jgi:SAM-dependent methyltransferase
MNDAIAFPRSLLHLLRCIFDAGELAVAGETSGDRSGILDGTLRCLQCSHEYSIEAGIARMLPSDRTQETDHEIELKDREYEAMPDAFIPSDSGWRSEYMDEIEIPPHLASLEPLQDRRVLEIGCGDGRFTCLMAEMGAEVLAVDFSLWALRKTQRNLAKGEPPTRYRLAAPRRTGNLTSRVGLVQADASQFHLAPRSFHRALSATPLDSRDERMKMFRAVADSLTDDGRYVAGVEYDDLSRRILGLPLVRRYSPGGILIEHLDRATMRREIAPYFGRMTMRPIRARLPLARLLPVKARVAAALAISHLPVLRDLGEILLVSAERPRRLPQDGVRRPDLFAARTLYRRYQQWRGKGTVWSLGDGPI